MRDHSGVIGVRVLPLLLSPKLARTLIPLTSYWRFSTRRFGALARDQRGWSPTPLTPRGANDDRSPCLLGPIPPPRVERVQRGQGPLQRSEIGTDRDDHPRPDRCEKRERKNHGYHDDHRHERPQPANCGALLADRAFRDVAVEADPTGRTRLEC